jgi:nitrate reductase NapAB chaperone NapD
MSINVVVPSSPEDRARIQSALSEISNAMTRIESERAYIKESLEMLEESFELPKKYMRKVALVYHKQNLNEVRNEFSDVEDIYNAVTS